MMMVQDRWGSPLVAGGYLAAVTISILPVAMISGRLSRVVDDNVGLLVAFAGACVSFALLFNFFRAPYFQVRTAEIGYYTCGSIGLLASMQLARGFLDALISKLIAPDRKQQLITAAMSIFMLGRGVGGTLGSWFTDQNSWVALHMCACMVTAILLLASFKFLQPWPTGTFESHLAKIAFEDRSADRELRKGSSIAPPPEPNVFPMSCIPQ